MDGAQAEPEQGAVGGGGEPAGPCARLVRISILLLEIQKLSEKKFISDNYNLLIPPGFVINYSFQ